MDSKELLVASKKILEASQEDHEKIMTLMSKIPSKDKEPKLGIFWYSPERKKLIGVTTCGLLSDNLVEWDSLVTLGEFHEDNYVGDIYARGLSKEKDYTKIPRGRVFFDPSSSKFRIFIGAWIDECGDAYQLILKEFNLENQNYEFKYDEHYEIGHGQSKDLFKKASI